MQPQDFALHALQYQPTYCNALGSCYTVDHYAKSLLRLPFVPFKPEHS